MSIFKAPPVEHQPKVSLTRWSIVTLPDGDKHFCGYHVEETGGRFSSKIVSFDPETMRGITRSGRVYHLVGEPGSDADARYVARLWLRINGIEEDAVSYGSTF